MREIKFRIFDTDIKEMVILENSGLQYYDFDGGYSLGFTVDGYEGFWAHENYDTATKKARKYPTMLYIGLEDKNGKDIYEGDYLVDRYPVDEEDLSLGYHESLTPVVWNKDTLQWCIDVSFSKNGSYLQPILSYFLKEHLEVKGNIYEEVKPNKD